MNKGDIAKIHRGPLAGMEITLKRHDAANKAWHGVLHPQKQVHTSGAVVEYKPNPGEVMVFDYELAETIERKKGKVKHG
jgi:hypothetical protein